MEINKPKIAVIMSLYANDSMAYVKDAIHSILQQTYAHFDFYILADGPIQKDTEEYITHLNDKRIIYQSRETNLGLAQSMNDLLDIVLKQPYDYIARMDADDISLPNRFAQQITYLECHPHVDCLGTSALEILSDQTPYYEKHMPQTHELCKQMFSKRDCIIHPTVMFRPSFFTKAGTYATDTYFGEDTMLWAQGFANGCIFANLDEILYLFRIDDHFFDRRRGWKHAKNIFLLRKRVIQMVGYKASAYFWAIAYAAAKMMPTKLLNLLYKNAR